jgi:intracellular septation protein A
MVRAAGTPTAPSRLEDLPDPTWRSILGRGLPQFAAEAVLPVLVFYGAWRVAGLGAGIAAGTVVSLALAAVLVRRGRDVTLVAIGAVVIVIQGLVGLASHSTTVYLAQPVLLNALWGLACFVSIALRRPLVGVLAGAWYPFPAWFRASDAFRREFSLQSAVFGVFYVARAGLRLWALLAAGVGGFVAVSVLTGSPLVLVLIAWGVWHARRAFSAL